VLTEQANKKPTWIGISQRGFMLGSESGTKAVEDWKPCNYEIEEVEPD
jgi:hypothetical protein